MTLYLDWLKATRACKDAITWSAEQGGELVTCWSACNVPGWLLWLLETLHIEDSNRRWRFGCRAIREMPLGHGETVWSRLTDDRSRIALETLEQYLDGKVSEEEQKKTANEARRVARRVMADSFLCLDRWKSAACVTAFLVGKPHEASSILHYLVAWQLKGHTYTTTSDVACACIWLSNLIRELWPASEVLAAFEERMKIHGGA